MNASFRVTNPPRRVVDAKTIDLQPGQVVITYQVSRRSGRQTVREYTVAATFTPRIENGRLSWTLADATVNGADATAEQLADINTRISLSLPSILRSRAETGRITGITITDTDLTVTFGR